jgi:hypothetical protein
MTCEYNSFALPGVCIMWITINTIFMQFLHYDSQHRNLHPDHYNVDVITQEDYKQLSNPDKQTVTLSNGTAVSNRSEAFFTNSLPKYKPVNSNSQYVLVTIRGTAPFMHQWYLGMLPIFILCIWGFFSGLRANRQTKVKLNQPIEGTA